ncbi:MAG TPA: hypothetical protein VNH64_03960 [Parvularculaceae bacterium]|nr:hypothetical protein [Parvularculaceae bacterium]
MGAIVKLILFLVGLIGLLLTALVAAMWAGVDVHGLMGHLGEGPAKFANCAVDCFASWLKALGGMMGSGDADHPSMLQMWGPVAIAGIISLLLLMFSMRRG